MMIRIALLLALVANHAPARPAETSVVGDWRLVPRVSHFGSYGPVACKALRIQTADDTIVIAFDQRLQNGKSQHGSMTLLVDGAITTLNTPQPLSPGDDWEAELRSASASRQGSNLVLNENDERRIDRSRTTELYRRGAQLVARTELRSIIGNRNAVLIFDQVAHASC